MSGQTLTSTPSRAIDLRGGPLRYREVGRGPVLVFVHGLFMNGDLWHRVVDDLSDRFRCIVPELPLGAHEAAMPANADVSPEGVTTLLLDFIAHLDVRGVTLVGSDTGGALCQLAIARRPAAVNGLVLTNCDSFEHFFPPALRAFQMLPRVPGFVWLLVQALRPTAVRRAFAASVALHVPEKAVLDALFAPMTRDANVRRDIERFCTSVSSRSTLAAATTFAGFEHPVLIAWGRNDLFFPQSDGLRLAESFPRTRLEWIDGSRTLVPEDQPARLAGLIAEFVGTFDAPRPRSGPTARSATGAPGRRGFASAAETGAQPSR